MPSPFLPDDNVRYDTSVRPSDAVALFARCLWDNTDSRIFGFQSPNPRDCGTLLADGLRATLLCDEEAALRHFHRRRCAVDPTAPPWPPRPGYVALLADQGRLPAQVFDDILGDPRDVEDYVEAAFDSGPGDDTPPPTPSLPLCSTKGTRPSPGAVAPHTWDRDEADGRHRRASPEPAPPQPHAPPVSATRPALRMRVARALRMKSWPSLEAEM